MDHKFKSCTCFFLCAGADLKFYEKLFLKLYLVLDYSRISNGIKSLFYFIGFYFVSLRLLQMYLTYGILVEISPHPP